MTYDVKNRVLHIGVYEKVELTNLEHKLMICLSSGNVATYEDMTEYLNVSKIELRQLKRRLMRKGLRIGTARGRGFKLADEIYFNWKKEKKVKGNKIKEFRKNKNLSQSDLAKLMKVKQNTISQWETGERTPGVIQVLRLAEILETTVEELYK